MIAGIIIGAIVLILIIFFVACYNKLVKGRITVEEAFSTMDVYLKKRFDLIPNLVETVKGYAKHEKETFSDVIKLRNKSYSNMSDEEKIEYSKTVSTAIPKIMALAEAYPDLKANQNFMELSGQLRKIEEDIANSRKYYNGAVKKYNMTVQSVPTNIVAGLFGFKPSQFLETPEEEKEVPKVSFDF